MEDVKDMLIQTLNSALETQKELNRQLQDQNASLKKTVEDLNVTIASLRETIEYLKNKIFGKTSEKTQDPDQPEADFFDEAEAESDTSIPEPTVEEIVQFKAKKGNRKGRDQILKDLPIKEVLCELEDHMCPDCGSEMEVIGKKFVREELMIRPAKIYRIHYYKEVLKCRNCSEKGDNDVIVESYAPVPLMAHSLASPSTVAYIMYMKYAMYEPLYRIEKDYAQMGAFISRGVMSNWIIYCALNYLKPIYKRLHEELLERDILHADEVPCQVLKEPDRKPQSKSYMWVYLTGNDGLPGITLYDYKPGRNGDYAKEFLKGFKGFLHCDGYKGYNNMKDVERIGCIAHARRYFFDAIPKRENADAPQSHGETGVKYFNKLFMIERELKKLAPDEIKKQREELESPVLREFFDWIKTLHPAKGSRLEKAVTYSINQEQNLMGYLKDGRLEISNNAAERRCKSYVMGRKAFLFHDQVDGAEASAIIYSLVESAKMNGLNIYSYLQCLLMYMPGYIKESEGIEDMMPWSDFMKERCPKVEKKESEIKPVGMK